MNVLISLHKGYGVGDGVQMSAVLRHVVAARPNWVVDYQAERGKEVVGRGIVNNVLAYGDPYPSPHYDAEVQICLYDTWANWGDRPNTRVSSSLHEQFDLEWLPEYGRYVVNVRECSLRAASALVRGVVRAEPATSRHVKNYVPKSEHVRTTARFVAVHYEGDSSPTRKNLTHSQADDVCSHVLKLGCIPIILDWRHKSGLPYRKVRVPQEWGRDAEMVCAVIRQCAAFVGIDSGPSKCASSTDVPALVTWTGHHPAPFHDPAPNTTHLVPRDYHGLHPVCNDRGVIDWFEANYNVRQYDRCPISEIRKWLSEVLS